MTTILRPAPRRLLRATYQVLWTTVAALVYAAGLVGAFFTLPPQAMGGLFLASSLLGASCALSLWAIESIRPARVAWAGLATGVVLLTLLGLSDFLGLAGVGLLILVHALSPTMLRRLTRLSGHSLRSSVDRVRAAASGEAPLEPRPSREPRRKPTSSPSPPAVEWPPTPVADAEVEALEVPDLVAVEDLCLAWQSSFLALKRCTTPEARLRVVAERQACLDELERRDPEALHAWLDDGARAASTPNKYLSH
ncbi:hypothetical protein [Nocardioides mesophilus]|uniref:Uncharacterized protein n=1 Tax=Nocardioides mesophilus TaxID=433659 RepID=A0A7G9R8E3_9ACTN|nr:hypothetical protein [Nocardioides mesophilus]QNN51868.1 hypothetical protein H9L09_15190 [Nocardioides mesophilus]